jgi:hypothetical protein
MFRRLLWKEFRALLPLWLALLAAGLAIVAGIASTEQRSSATPLISLAISLAGCFGIAAAAMQFAGEVEDGTAGWLRSLPLEGQNVWSAKLLVNAGGSMALLYIMGALVSWTWFSMQRPSPEAAFDSMEYFNSERMVRFSLGAPFLAAAVSVRLRGVLAAVLATAVISGVCAWLGSVVTTRHSAGPAWAVLAIQTVLAIWLSRKWTISWCQSLDFATPRPETFVATRMAVAHRPWWDVWCDRSPVWRMWRSLVWQELRRARLFALWWLGLFATGVTLTFLDLANLRFVMLLGYGTAALAGVWSLWGEQRRGFHAFLGDRGVPSAPVWWSKHGVWALLAILLTLPCVFFDAWVEGIPLSGAVYSLSGQLVRQAEVLQQGQQTGPMDFSLSGAPLNRNPLPVRLLGATSSGLSNLAALYAIGHLASLCSTRLVLTLVVTFVGTVAWFAWSQSQATFNGVSIWTTGALVSVGALLASGILVDRWLARRSLAWGRGLILAGSLLGCLLASSGFAWARYWSLPSAPLPESLQKELAAMEARMKSVDVEATRDYRRLFDELAELRSLNLDVGQGKAGPGGEPGLVAQPQPQVAPEQDVKPWLAWLDRLADAGEKHASGGRRPLMSPYWFRGGFSGETVLLSDTSAFDEPLASLREAGEVEREWRELLGLLRCNRLEKSQAPWLMVSRWTGRQDLAIFRRIVDWASLPSVSPDQLAEAIHQLRDEARGLPPVYEHWLARNVLARWYLRGETSKLMQFVDGHEQGLVTQFAHAGGVPSGLWNGRLERAVHATWAEQWIDFTFVDALTRRASGSVAWGRGLSYVYDLDIDSTSLESPALSALGPGPVRDELLHAPYPLKHFLVQHGRYSRTIEAVALHNRYRLLLTALVVLHHHKQHGALPTSLFVLRFPHDRATPGAPGDPLPVDFFTGEPFEYAPAGLGLPAIGNRNELLKADQPVLRAGAHARDYWQRTRWLWPEKPPLGEPVEELLDRRWRRIEDRRMGDAKAPHSWAKPSTLAVLYDID